MKYQKFIFKKYNFDKASKTLVLNYSLDDEINFKEIYTFNFDFTQYNELAAKRAFQNLFFMAGVSYFKTYAPPEISVEDGELNEIQSEFFTKTYQNGLGEFWYVNKLNPRTAVNFPVNTADSQPITTNGTGMIVSVGGGKDSLLTIELLKRSGENISTWSLNHKSQLQPLVDRIGTPHLWVDRTLDPQLVELNKNGAMNGHVPISAIFACVGTVVAILSGKRDVVMSNEQSANEPTLEYQGVQINHQYSKSQEFETDYQKLLSNCFGGSQRYYSFLRPFSELYISELFAKFGFDKYKGVFSSCNRAFVASSHHMSWCGECPKCAFVFMALSPFVNRSELEQVFGGKNLLLDPSLTPMYNSLLGIEGDKPLECVGEIQESRAAMRLNQKLYPELSRYMFDLPDNYDYNHVSSHSMPLKIYEMLIASLNQEI